MSYWTKKELLPVRVLNSTHQAHTIHHDTLLYYILEGSMELTTADRFVHMGVEDLIAINPGKTTSFKASQNILFMEVTIPNQLVRTAVSSDEIVFMCDSTTENHSQYSALRHVLKEMLNRHYSLMGHGEDYGYESLCYRLLDILISHFFLKIGDQLNTRQSNRFDDRILRINQFVHSNYHLPITSKDVSETLHLTQSYLSRFFKKYYGMSLADYLTKIRLHHAMEDLLYSNTPITRIAFDNGFSNISAMTKAFKAAYGKTPSTLRRSRKEQPESPGSFHEDTVVKERVETYLRLNQSPSEDYSQTDFIVEECSTQFSQPLVNFWGDTINVGTASDLLKSEVRDHILILSQMLHVRYIRFWNIFSEEMLLAFGGQDGTYNFSKLDGILDFFLENELRPHIELGMKPRRLYRDVKQVLVEESVDARTVRLDEWERAVYALMRHLENRYRRSVLNTWRMELWFHEDQWGQKGALDQYLDHFSILYRIIKRHAPKLEVGGCGLRVGFRDVDEEIPALLHRWKESAEEPDFISMLYYPYQRGEVNRDCYSKRMADDSGLLHRVEHMRSLLKEAGFSHSKLYVTEWNITVSDRNYINDSCFKGAYVIKNVIENYGQVHLLSYFHGSDRISEHYDSLGLLHGGCGLLSKDGIVKPAGHALRFLNWLCDGFVWKGQHSIVTTDGQGSFAIVCHNQKPLNYVYYMTAESEIEKENIWKYCENRTPLSLRLNLRDVPNGTYQIKTYQINEQVGSPLEFWREMNFETELSRNDISYLQQVCGPRLTIHTQEVSGGELSIQLPMKPNEFCFIRIHRK